MTLFLAACSFTLSVACALSAQAASIYVSEGSTQRLPIYTDRPLNTSSKLLLVLPPHSLVQTPSAAIERRSALLPAISRAAQRFRIDEALLHAVIDVESGFDAQARSAKGAIGLMQVMPATAARYGRFDLRIPEQNIEAGTRHLQGLLALFNGNLPLALAAYNAGEAAVAKHGNRIPPFAETQRYVPMVLARYRSYHLANPVAFD